MGECCPWRLPGRGSFPRSKPSAPRSGEPESGAKAPRRTRVCGVPFRRSYPDRFHELTPRPRRETTKARRGRRRSQSSRLTRRRTPFGARPKFRRWNRELVPGRRVPRRSLSRNGFRQVLGEIVVERSGGIPLSRLAQDSRDRPAASAANGANHGDIGVVLLENDLGALSHFSEYTGKVVRRLFRRNTNRSHDSMIRG